MTATTTRFTLVLVSLFALVVAGCGGGGETSTGTESTGSAAGAGEGSGDAAASTPTVKTCNDHKALSLCAEHGPEALAVLGEAFYKNFCEVGEGGGIWGSDPCPTENRLATCDDGGGNLTHYYTDGGEPWDQARAEKECKELMGKLAVH